MDFKILLLGESIKWIKQQRAINWASGAKLDRAQQEVFLKYFLPSTLESIRVLQVDEILNPPFYEQVDSEFVNRYAIDFRKMVGITFFDCILINRFKISEVDPIRLMFHECVHVAQYKHLSVEGFVASYLSGWDDTQGIDYYAIELEKEAYGLDEKFTSSPSIPFSVEDVVKQRRH